jgi:hypothetical protein
VSRGRRSKYGAWRTALPPLHDKEVELISIIPYLLHPLYKDRYEVKLKIDGKLYVITKRNCRDELAALAWLVKLRTRVSKNNHAAGSVSETQGAN